MHCIVQFRMLIFILTYVWCIFNVSCNNVTSEAEKNNPGAGKLSTNSSHINVALVEVHSNKNKTSPMFSEGGSMSSVVAEKDSDSSTTSKANIQNEALNEKLPQFDVQDGLNDSKAPRRDGRKGVSKETSSEETVDHSDDEIVKTESPVKSSVAANLSTLTSSTIGPAGNFTTNSTIANGTSGTTIPSQENLSQGSSGSTASLNTTVSVDSRNRIQSSTTEKLNVTELAQPPKSKPEFTRDDSDVDDNSSYSLTNPENDYVIPIVATIFAAPLLVVLAMFLYKRSKEFWERRHYRRMDFLIDGMYND